MTTPIYVTNNDPQYCTITYYDNGDASRRKMLESGWLAFNQLDPVSHKWHRIRYRKTRPDLGVAVDYRMPPDTPAGYYRVEAFIPGRHATTRQAMVLLAQNFRDESGKPAYDDIVMVVDMHSLYDAWVTLGETTLNPGRYDLSGRVRIYDLSQEDPSKEISFGPVRYTPLPAPSSNDLRCDSPVGSPQERQGSFPTGKVAYGRYPIWAGDWFDVNPYLTWYRQGYHTGADLNLPGASSADRGKPVYAAADGRVTFAGPAGSWGYIVVIEHNNARITLPSGLVQRQKVYTRYGHVEREMQVRAGETVRRGQQIATVGLPAGQTSGWHLHFDVSFTTMLYSRPSHWPNLTAIRELQKKKVSPSSPQYQQAQAAIRKEVLTHYADPLQFIKDNHA